MADSSGLTLFRPCWVIDSTDAEVDVIGVCLIEGKKLIELLHKEKFPLNGVRRWAHLKALNVCAKCIWDHWKWLNISFTPQIAKFLRVVIILLLNVRCICSLQRVDTVGAICIDRSYGLRNCKTKIFGVFTSVCLVARWYYRNNASNNQVIKSTVQTSKKVVLKTILQNFYAIIFVTPLTAVLVLLRQFTAKVSLVEKLNGRKIY